MKTINFENKLIKLQIWDTIGQEKFNLCPQVFYKGAHGLVLMYDVTDQNSFKRIKNWLK